MKLFNLEGAIAGEPIRCRDERYKAEFGTYNENANNFFDTLICWITDTNSGYVFSRTFRSDGAHLNSSENSLDLFMDTKTKWVRLYEEPGGAIKACQSSGPDNFVVPYGDWVSDPVEIKLY